MQGTQDCARGGRQTPPDRSRPRQGHPPVRPANASTCPTRSVTEPVLNINSSSPQLRMSGMPTSLPRSSTQWCALTSADWSPCQPCFDASSCWPCRLSCRLGALLAHSASAARTAAALTKCTPRGMAMGTMCATQMASCWFWPGSTSTAAALKPTSRNMAPVSRAHVHCAAGPCAASLLCIATGCSHSAHTH
jgi:hypothetical protein